jgi:glutathionylspermidine synthase
LVRDSWEKRETDFLGRFDFLIDRKGNVKLLEYNGDTPTLLIESGRVQNLVYENIKKED